MRPGEDLLSLGTGDFGQVHLRLHDGSGRAVGMGLLLPDGHALTCDHVVASALGGRPGGNPARVAVSLPLAPSGARDHRYEATVTHRDEAADVAVLRVADPPAVPVVPLAEDGDVGEEFLVFGVPGRIEDGAWAEGTLSGPTAAGRQMNGTGGIPLQRGFSGAPVWDRDREAVVGMLSLAMVSPAGGPSVGTMVSLGHACRSWPPLSDRLQAAAVPGLGGLSVPRLLWSDVDTFTGRAAELDRVLERLADPDAGSVAVSAVAGMGGVGKTAFAVHAAHRSGRLFPDGQLAVDLRGTDPHGGLSPFDALGRLLRQMIDTTAIAARPADRYQQYQRLLHDRRVFLLLDNASSEQQVAPLMPAGHACAALVTSRRRLQGLDNVLHVPLDVLDTGDALALLGKLVGAGLAESDPASAGKVVDLCGGLPLAIKLAAGMIQPFPQRGLKYLAGRLAGDRGSFLRHTTAGQSLEATFTASYDTLSSAEQRAFRLLALTGDADSFGPGDVAAVTGAPHGTAETIADQLTLANLVEDAGVSADGLPRYRLHDLLRVFAAERLDCDSSEAERAEAGQRLVTATLGLLARAHGAAATWDEGVQDPGGEE